MPDLPTQMIVTAQPEASEAGARVLMRGGNAVDAAMAAALVAGVVDPQMCGIAGFGSCQILDPATGRHEVIDFHGRTYPATAVEYIEAMAPYRPYFCEEPVPPENASASSSSAIRKVTIRPSSSARPMSPSSSCAAAEPANPPTETSPASRPDHDAFLRVIRFSFFERRVHLKDAFAPTTHSSTRRPPSRIAHRLRPAFEIVVSCEQRRFDRRIDRRFDDRSFARRRPVNGHHPRQVRAENHRLVGKRDTHAVMFEVAQETNQRFGSMVRVDQDLFYAPTREEFQVVLQHRLAPERQQGLGDLSSQGEQPGPESGREHDGFSRSFPIHATWSD